MNTNQLMLFQCRQLRQFVFKFKYPPLEMDVNQIFFFGHNKYGQAGIGQDEHNKKYSHPKQIVFKNFIKQVSCGHHHSVLLTIDGLIYTMGSNIHGTLGLGNSGSINYAFKPTLVKDLKDVDQVFSGSYHMCALKQGELYSWGKGIDGQLGHGNMKNVFVPTKVQALGADVQTVSCGMNYTLVTVSKSVNNLNGYAFGNGIYGQLGCGSNRSYNYPINIKLPDIQSVSAGENHSLFVSDGKVYGCGDNSSFQIGSFDDAYKNKKYILEPVKVNFFMNQDVSFIHCHNLSTALTSKGTAYAWGGKNKIWPPAMLDEKDVINIQVASQKIYLINTENELISISFKSGHKLEQEKEIILKSHNVLDFDAGQHHLLALGDIVAQADEKDGQASILSIWAGESLRSSKETFSQKSLSQQLTGNIHANNEPIHKKMSDYFFTRHLQSGMSEEESYKSESQLSQQNTMCFKSVDKSPDESLQDKTSIMNTNTYDNMSSEIEIEARNPFEINQTQNKQYLGEKGFVKLESRIKQNEAKFEKQSIERDVSIILQNKKFSQNKLQKLMDEMEIKTVHLKKKYPIEDKENQHRQINKTPSSYIKKEPENFVLESGQANHLKSVSSFPKISNFEETLEVVMPLKEIHMENQNTSGGKRSNDISKSKSRAKSIIYYNQKSSPNDQEHQVSGFFKSPQEVKQKEEGPSIEAIFMQLLKKQKMQKASHQKTPRQSKHRDFDQGQKKSQRLSHSCIESKVTEPSTSQFEKDQSQSSEMPKLVPINSMVRTPINESKLKVSKMSDASNISGKSNFRRNTDILEITRSNRELRFELRDRDLKISHLQEDLSKKDIEIETLYKQLEYFKNLRVSCQQCGSSTSVQDPFASV